MKNIESKFKNALENHEVDYDPQAFASFKEKLDGGSGVSSGGGSNKLTKLGIAASIIGVVSIGSYFLFSESNNKVDSKVDDNTEYVEHIENSNSSNDKLTSGDEVHVNNNIVIEDHSEDSKDENFTTEIKNEVYDHQVVEGDKDDSEFTLDSQKEEKGHDLVESNQEENKKVSTIVLNSNFSSSKITGCEGLVCNFKPKQSANYKGDYVWDFGDGSFSKERSPSHKYSKAGSYVVRLTLRSEINNSVISDHTEEYVTVYSKPKANFEVEEMNNTSIPEFTFINTTDNAINWSWSFGDKANNSSDRKDPSHTYRKKGTYTVKLTAENGFGCATTITKRVSVENDYNLLAPTGFTPNADGLNDYYLPRALEIMDAKFTMNIFHKNGKLYYETNQVSRPWDGRYMIDNQNAPAGAYVWVVKLKNKDGETEIYRGSVTLLRD